MSTIIGLVFAVVGMYIAIGLVGIMVWDITAEIVGVFEVPSWMDKMYDFIVEKMFFF